MSQRGKSSETPYMQLMRQAVNSLVGEGWDAFNQDQLVAEMTRINATTKAVNNGAIIKKTDSFRRRLNQLVASQVLVSWAYYTDKGGTGMAYANAKIQQTDMFAGHEL